MALQLAYRDGRVSRYYRYTLHSSRRQVHTISTRCSAKHPSLQNSLNTAFRRAAYHRPRNSQETILFGNLLILPDLQNYRHQCPRRGTRIMSFIVISKKKTATAAVISEKTAGFLCKNTEQIFSKTHFHNLLSILSRDTHWSPYCHPWRLALQMAATTKSNSFFFGKLRVHGY